MLSPGQFSRAPILEAILSIRLEKMPETVLPPLKTLIESWGSFPAVANIVENLVNFHSESPLTEKIELGEQGIEKQGYMGIASDQRSQVQLRTDGFSFHRLAPYGDWNSFRDIARPLWEAYRLVAPSPVQAIELRYFNRLELPLQEGSVDFNEYLNMRVEVPPSLPHGALSNYFFRVEMPQPDLEAISVVQQGMVAPELEEGKIPENLEIILDNHLISGGSITDEEIWPLFERFRERKNEIFEAALTPKMQELIF